jgi:hypothetical protein
VPVLTKNKMNRINFVNNNIVYIHKFLNYLSATAFGKFKICTEMRGTGNATEHKLRAHNEPYRGPVI